MVITFMPLLTELVLREDGFCYKHGAPNGAIVTRWQRFPRKKRRGWANVRMRTTGGTRKPLQLVKVEGNYHVTIMEPLGNYLGTMMVLLWNYYGTIRELAKR